MNSAYEQGCAPEIRVHHRLRIAREHVGLEQSELAELIGISRNSVSAAEKGHTAPRKITLNAWALACGVPVSWLRDGVTRSHPDIAPSGVGRGSAIAVDLELPQQSRLVVMNADGAVDESATRALGELSELRPSTLRLTAECSAKLSYRGLRGGSLRVRRGAGATGCHLSVAA